MLTFPQTRLVQMNPVLTQTTVESSLLGKYGYHFCLCVGEILDLSETIVPGSIECVKINS